MSIEGKNYFNDDRPNPTIWQTTCSSCRAWCEIEVRCYPHGPNEPIYCPVCGADHDEGFRAMESTVKAEGDGQDTPLDVYDQGYEPKSASEASMLAAWGPVLAILNRNKEAWEAISRAAIVFHEKAASCKEDDP